MAGSLMHIVGEDGRFSMETIENMGDAHEALEDCFNIIIELSNGNMELVNAACELTKQPKIPVQMIREK